MKTKIVIFLVVLLLIIFLTVIYYVVSEPNLSSKTIYLTKSDFVQLYGSNNSYNLTNYTGQEIYTFFTEHFSFNPSSLNATQRFNLESNISRNLANVTEIWVSEYLNHNITGMNGIEIVLKSKNSSTLAQIFISPIFSSNKNPYQKSSLNNMTYYYEQSTSSTSLFSFIASYKNYTIVFEGNNTNIDSFAQMIYDTIQ